MTDTENTQKSALLLDQAEEQVAAALRLGRRLLASPDPSRPIYQLRLHTTGGNIGLNVWAGKEDPDAVQAWATLLDAPLKAVPYEDHPAEVHFSAQGPFEGIPLYVWAVVTIPITAAAIVSNSRTWRVSYRQGDARRSITQPNRAAAQHWIAKHAPAKVTK